MNNDQIKQDSGTAKSSDSALGSVASDLKAAASSKFGQAAREARTMADDAKSDVADEVKDVASALRRASEELRGGSAQERTLGQIADVIADASDSIRDKDLGEILAMVSRKGRENPVLFLGGAALLGFAASRYAKASAKHDYTSGSRNLGGTDYSSGAQMRGSGTLATDDFVAEGNPNTKPVVTVP